ncbi:MAG: alpha-E domain-containing protein [Acetobacteraceae bacterium]
MSEVLLARYAECIFWLARYVERAENLARILDVNETFTRDARGDQNWESIVHLHADEEEFHRRHGEASAEAVLRFYVTDATNPSSIVSAIRNARENARALRPLISTEMWVQLNVFQNRLNAIEEPDLAPGRLTDLFSAIKEACQTHTGITEGTFYRDQGWYFYQLGRYIERADQTTRLLDMKYHLLLPHAAEDVGSPIDVGQWNALLRSAAGYHAYRRQHPRGITPGRVAGFLLLNSSFPRSVFLCVHEVEILLTDLKRHFGLRGGIGAAEELDQLRALLSTLTITEILAQGLHEFLDMIQRRLITITRDLSNSFFGTPPRPAQMQTQSAPTPTIA